MKIEQLLEILIIAFSYLLFLNYLLLPPPKDLDPLLPKDLEDEDKKANIIASINNPRYIIYDFETDTHTNVHKTNLCIASVLKMSDDNDYDKSLESTVTFEGYDCCDKFCDWLFSKENSNSTVFAHNQAGYDGKFILAYCIKKGLLPDKYIVPFNFFTISYNFSDLSVDIIFNSLE